MNTQRTVTPRAGFRASDAKVPMPYATPPNLSFCLVEEMPIFLDIESDRYFGLANTLAASFRALLRGDHAPRSAVEALIQKGVIAQSDSSAELCPVEIAIPTYSLTEDRTARMKPSMATTAEVGAVLLKNWLQLRHTPFKHVLRERRDRKQREFRQNDDREIYDLAANFYAARRRVPIRPVCLLDSLSLLDFLARRGQFPNLVLGVRRNPFAAHCWVQTDDRLLNEAVDFAVSFKPILVV